MKKVRHRFIKNLRYLCLIGVIALGLMTIIGSGGGGDDGGGGGDTTPTTDTTGTLRTYKVGDTISYQATFDYDYPWDLDFVGEVTYLLDNQVTNTYGITCLSYTLSGILTAEGTSIPIRDKGLIYQDEDGNLYDCGNYDDDNNEYVFVLETSDTPNGLALLIKNPVTVGDVISMTTYYEDDSWEDCTSRVDGKETVQTLKGDYEAYKISASCSESDGDTITATYWLYPSIYHVMSREYLVSSNVIAELTLNLKDYGFVD